MVAKNVLGPTNTHRSSKLLVSLREGHPLETNESIKLDKWIVVTNYVLVTFVLISLIKEYKQLEMAGENP